MGYDNERRLEDVMAPARVVGFGKQVGWLDDMVSRVSLGGFLCAKLVPLVPTADSIARPASRWEHLGTFEQDGLRFDVWVNWDGRAKVEHAGRTVLAFWYPGADIFRGIHLRATAKNVIGGPW